MRTPANAMRISRIAADFDALDAAVTGLFEGCYGVDLLLDTHVFLWWDTQYPALNAGARTAIADPGNPIFVSAASVWEVAIKRRLGKLAFQGSPSAAIGANGFFALPVLPIDAEEAGALPWNHSDPFDRMLLAQARRAGLTLVTADSLIRAQAGVALFWAG